MCLCRKRPCCRCIWKRCSCCARHIFCIRVILILFSLIDILTMLWYLDTVGNTSGEITNCCSPIHLPPASIDDSSLLSNYSMCMDLDYTHIALDDYFDVISPFNKHFLSNIKENHWRDVFYSVFTYYDMNITVGEDGGCIYNTDTNCLAAIDRCVDIVQNDTSESVEINKRLSSMCQDSISDDEVSIIVFGIIGIVALKISLSCLGICAKLCKRELRPENEYIRNLMMPLFIPSFFEQQKKHKQRQKKALLHRMEHLDSTPHTIRTERSESNIGKSYYEYYRLEDRRKNRNIFCKAFICLLEYFFIFIIYVFKLIVWLFKTSVWIILLILNFVCSVLLFYVHHSPVLGVDTLDFCTDSQMNNDESVKEACNVGQAECGIMNWVILPNVSMYLIPRYLTLSVSFLACLCRCIERFAGFKLQELIARKEINVRDLKVDEKTVNAFEKALKSSHRNKKIGSQFRPRLGDELVDDLSITQSQIEMSYTSSLQSKPKKQRLFSSLDVLNDHKKTVMGSEDDEDHHDILSDYSDTDDEDDVETQKDCKVQQISSLKGDLAILDQSRNRGPSSSNKRKLSL